MTPINIDYNGYLITTDKKLLQPAAIHKWLSEQSYWAKHIAYNTVKISFDHSFCIGAILKGEQIAFARLITDYATFGYLADVYVVEEHRGKGISKIMIGTLFNFDWVKQVRRVILTTADAHSLYGRFGFSAPVYPERLMEWRKNDVNNFTK